MKVLEESGMFRRGKSSGYLNRRGMAQSVSPGAVPGGELQRFCVAVPLFEGTHFCWPTMSTMLDVITQAQI